MKKNRILERLEEMKPLDYGRGLQYCGKMRLSQHIGEVRRNQKERLK